MPPKSRELSNTDLRITDLEKSITKLMKDTTSAIQLATKAVRENGLLKIEIQRLTTRINTNENNIRHNSPKR